MQSFYDVLYFWIKALRCLAQRNFPKILAPLKEFDNNIIFLITEPFNFYHTEGIPTFDHPENRKQDDMSRYFLLCVYLLKSQ